MPGQEDHAKYVRRANVMILVHQSAHPTKQSSAAHLDAARDCHASNGDAGK